MRYAPTQNSQLSMRASDFDYDLPPHLIAQTPADPRDSARLLVLRRGDGALRHHIFRDLPDLLRPGDVLVANNSRVLPARLHGHRAETGGAVEVLLLHEDGPDEWVGLVRPGRRIRPGDVLLFGAPAGSMTSPTGSVSLDNARTLGALGADEAPTPASDVAGPGTTESPATEDITLTATVLERLEGGERRLRLAAAGGTVGEAIHALGATPLPPYIHAPLADPERYQTVYARQEGSVAAPTAGLHFTPDLLRRLEARGIAMRHVTLHVGAGTFKPLQGEEVAAHRMHAEWAELDAATAEALNRIRAEGRRLVAVGTTTVRVLETAATAQGLQPFRGWTRAFITPGYTFRAVDALITNFHLPRSTLLLLVSAFAGKDAIDRAYAAAIAHGYRFYSFGDAMLLL